jgi:hypothetical protein
MSMCKRKRKLALIKTNTERSEFMSALSCDGSPEAVVQEALAGFRNVPHVAWLTIFQAACLTLDHRHQLAPVLRRLLEIKSGLHTREALDDANEQLPSAARAVAAGPHSSAVYALYTAASLSSVPSVPLRLRATPCREYAWPLDAPFELPPFVCQTSTRPVTFALEAAAEELCAAIEYRVGVAAVQAAFAIVAASERESIMLSCDRALDVRGTLFKRYFRSFTGPSLPLVQKLHCSSVMRADVLVSLIVGAYAERCGMLELADLCLWVHASSRWANYYSPYAMAAALVTMLIYGSQECTLPQVEQSVVPANAVLYPLLDAMEYEDRTLASTTTVDAHTGATALMWIAASSFGQTAAHNTVAFASRVSDILLPEWQRRFPPPPAEPEECK